MKTIFSAVLLFVLLVGLSHSQMGELGRIKCQSPPYHGGLSYTPVQNGYQNGARVSVGEPPMKSYVCFNGQWFD